MRLLLCARARVRVRVCDVVGVVLLVCVCVRARACACVCYVGGGSSCCCWWRGVVWCGVMYCDVWCGSAMGFVRAVRSGSCLVRHLQYSLGGNALEMGIRLRGERMSAVELVRGLAGWAFAPMPMMTKWFSSTRLETRTKESNMCASSLVIKLACVMKVTAGILALAADQSIERGLSMSTSVRTRKMVNYA